MFHRHWVKTTGRVLDSRIREMYSNRPEGRVGTTLPLHNYVVEFVAPDGTTKKLEVEQHLDTIDVTIGDDVALLVKPDGTEAIFDKHDPALGVEAVADAARASDEARFRGELDG